MAQKLIKKPDVSATSSKSIMEIASMLRNGSVDEQSPESAKEITENENQKESPIFSEDSKQVPNDVLDSKSLVELVEIIKSRNYVCKDIIYVDSELKEVFSLLKAKLKIPISPLVSYILEDWVLQHERQIADLINSKKNRYL